MRTLLARLWPRSQSYSRDVVTSFGTELVITALGLLTGILVARLLGAEGRGQLAAIQALPMIIGSLGQLGLNEAVVYFGGRDRARAGLYSISAAACIAVFAVPIVLVADAFVPWFLREQTSTVVLASQIYMFILFGHALDGISINLARALHDIPLWNALRFIPRALWGVVVVVFYFAGIAEPATLALAYLGSYIVVAALMVLIVRRKMAGQWVPRPALWKPMLKYGLPISAGVAPRLLNIRLDQLLMAGVLPAAELGLYSVAVSLANLAAMPGIAMSTVAFSKIAGMPDFGDRLRFVRKATLAVLAITSGVALVLGLLAVPALWLFGDEGEFVPAAPIVHILLVSMLFQGVARMIQTGLQGTGRTVAVMAAHWSGFGVLLPAMLVLIPRHGVNGAAWALVASAATSLVVSLALAARRVENLPPEA